ncbi:MAG: polysaccharide biosynthesis/export family protein [Balneolales bacterium]
MTTNTGNINKLSFSVFQVMAILILLFCMGCATSGNLQEQTPVYDVEQADSQVADGADNEEIRTGDQIEITVWEYDEFETNRSVNNRGFLLVPLLGEIEARGLTMDTFTENLRGELSEYIKGDFNLSVSVSSADGNMVSVLGSVSRPDNYEIGDDISLLEILSRAGGTTDRADLRNITIYKETGTGERMTVDLTRHLYGKTNPTSIAVIYPGNVIYVPQQENVIREMSEFMRDVVLLFGMYRIFN